MTEEDNLELKEFFTRIVKVEEGLASVNKRINTDLSERLDLIADLNAIKQYIVSWWAENLGQGRPVYSDSVSHMMTRVYKSVHSIISKIERGGHA